MNGDTRLLDPVRDWDHAKGPAYARLVMAEYGDYECPDCGRLFDLLRGVQGELGSRLRLVYRHYPMSRVNQRAQMAPEAAGAQGQFWEMHDLLFQNQQALKREDLLGYVKRLGLDVDRVERELKEETYAAR